MKIVPKIAEFDCDFLFKYLDIINDSLEIQLLSKRFTDSLCNIEKICKYYKNLTYVVLHLPFNRINICHIHSSYSIELDFIMFVVKLMELSRELNIDFDILFHIEKTGEAFEDVGGLNFLNYICELVKDSRVSFLLENSIRDINIHLWDIDNVTYIFNKIDNYKLNFCLDLCHLHASEYVYKKDFRLSLNSLKHLKNIHFSKTLNEDGYIDKKRTHGRVHDNKEDILNDLHYLENKGVILDNLNIVLEISEDDYIERPDLKREFELFKELKKDGSIIST